MSTARRHMTPSKGNASILEWTSPGSDTTSSEGDLSTSSIISYLGSDSQSSDGILSTTSSNSSSPQSFSRGGQGSKLVLPRGPTSTLLPVESLHLSELPRSVPQLVAEIEEWKQDLSRTELELKSVSEESFLSLRPRLTDLEMSETSSQYFILKAMYTSQLQQVELSKLSWVNWSASQNFVRMILDEIQNIGGDTERGLLWSNTLSLKISDGYFCRAGEGADEKTDKWFTYMEADCCVKLQTLRIQRKKRDSIYDEVLPTLIVMSGVDTWNKKIKEDVDRWLGKRKGVSTEVNAVIHQSLNFDDTSLSIEISVFSRRIHYDLVTDKPLAILDPSYHLYSQLNWKQEWGVTAKISGSLSLPPSVLWGIGKCPEGFPDNHRITLSTEELGRYSSGLLMDHRQEEATAKEIDRLQKLGEGLAGV